jgi:hypothetical protein
MSVTITIIPTMDHGWYHGQYSSSSTFLLIVTPKDDKEKQHPARSQTGFLVPKIIKAPPLIHPLGLGSGTWSGELVLHTCQHGRTNI